MKHKSQHSIPKCYLKAWCDTLCPKGFTPYVWVFPKDSRKGRKRSPEKTFIETDLYTIHHPNGERDLILEHGLSQLESDFTRIRRNVLNKRKNLPDEDRLKLCVFTAAMFARTTRHHEHTKQQWQLVKDKMEQMMEWAKTATEEQKRAMSHIERPSGGTGKGLGYKEVKELAESPMRFTLPATVQALITPFYNMSMAILETDDDIGFITSDAPCVWFDAEACKRPPFYQSVGLMYPTIEITLPLSPSQMLFICHNQNIRGYIKMKPEMTDEFNRRTRFHAHDSYVVNRNESREIWFEKGEEPEDSWRKKQQKESHNK